MITEEGTMVKENPTESPEYNTYSQSIATILDLSRAVAFFIYSQNATDAATDHLYCTKTPRYD